MKLTFGFTPCPNDAFAFHALVHGLVPAPFEVEPVLLDIEELNRRAGPRRAPAHEAELRRGGGRRGDRYRLLRSGAALGRGVGPLVVAREPGSLEEAAAGRIAVPGRETTAFLLLRLAAPALGDVVELRYDRILDAVVAGEVDAGLIIHESRFTYARARARRGRRPRRVVGGRDRPARPAGRDLRAERPRAGARGGGRGRDPRLGRVRVRASRRRAATTSARSRRRCRTRSARRTSRST